MRSSQGFLGTDRELTYLLDRLVREGKVALEGGRYAFRTRGSRSPGAPPTPQARKQAPMPARAAEPYSSPAPRAVVSAPPAAAPALRGSLSATPRTAASPTRASSPRWATVSDKAAL